MKAAGYASGEQIWVLIQMLPQTATNPKTKSKGGNHEMQHTTFWEVKNKGQNDLPQLYIGEHCYVLCIAGDPTWEPRHMKTRPATWRSATLSQSIWSIYVLLTPRRVCDRPQARLDILKIHSRKMNLTRGINLRKIAELMPGASGAEVKVSDPKPRLRFYLTARVGEHPGYTTTPHVLTSSLKWSIHEPTAKSRNRIAGWRPLRWKDGRPCKCTAEKWLPYHNQL